MHSKTGISRMILAAVGAASIAVAGCAGMGMFEKEIKVTMTGSNEVPPTGSAASGSASFWVKADRSVSGAAQVSGFTASAAHIHTGAPGANGPVAVGLVQTSPGTWSVPAGAMLTEDQYRAFRAGQTYVNAHSARFPGGEIRGQLAP